MLRSSRPILLSACLIALPASALAEGVADRHNEAGIQQSMDPIEQIHSMYGPTAAGPGGMEQDMAMEGGMKKADSHSNVDFPPGVDTAHERKRYMFDSEEF
ncbi:hypothetical protein [Marinobacter zhejiangensis]|uniref:Uncharacterized protein n=1 Tax=Marinobacter zhejiangensis TaxID=488535 RepID=A0A1I4Q9F3_9GAMM|nr:hypothetical protein [Marinobacter zhejiangensis]SFM36305.1 hypothetical protein SAMN04487963_2241 [Marinobacter zhejiangensis]